MSADLLISLLPFLAAIEALYVLVGLVGILFLVQSRRCSTFDDEAAPLLTVSCVITCYSEGRDVQGTIRSLIEQDYAGVIEIIPVIDGAGRNRETLAAALEMSHGPALPRGRRLRIVPKWVRGGRSSSLNAGLTLATGDLVMALDGDTSFDRNMVRLAVLRFADERLMALAGTLKVRNAGANWLTRLQALDYVIFRQFVRAGLGRFGLVSNIPGAHGIFRRSMLMLVGGWDTGSAEDVDLTFRLRKYAGRCHCDRMSADPHVISLTDVPDTLAVFLRQRLRWEGDPAYLYLRKHRRSLRPSVMGWRHLLFALCYGGCYQIVMPLLMLFALVYLLLVACPVTVGQALLTVYGIYLSAFTIALVVHVGLLSERRRGDLGLMAWLPLYPPFVLMLRLWSAAAVLHSLLLRSHLDSGMAPWWVLRKGKF